MKGGMFERTAARAKKDKGSSFCLLIQYLFQYLISWWMQTAGPQFENLVPAPELSFLPSPIPSNG
jgi:hypothetical protein